MWVYEIIRLTDCVRLADWMGLTYCTNMSGWHACGLKVIKTLKTLYTHKRKNKINTVCCVKAIFQSALQMYGNLYYELLILCYEFLYVKFKSGKNILNKNYLLRSVTYLLSHLNNAKYQHWNLCVRQYVSHRLLHMTFPFSQSRKKTFSTVMSWKRASLAL